MGVPVQASRGVIYVDENLSALVPHLREKGFNPRVAPMGTSDDDLMQYYIPERKFVSNNSKDFFYEIPVHEFGLISTEGVSKDPKGLAKQSLD